MHLEQRMTTPSQTETARPLDGAMENILDDGQRPGWWRHFAGHEDTECVIRPMHLASLLDRAARTHGNRLAIRFQNFQMTYSRLHEAAERFAEALRLRDPAALAAFKEEHAEEVGFWAFVQYEFARQWRALHAYAKSKGVSIMGDIPIYVAADSADAWAGRELFETDADGNTVDLTDEQKQYLYDTSVPAVYSDSTLEDTLSALGYVERSKPSKVNLYASTFSDKDAIGDCIERYNSALPEDDQITYTDYVALLMRSVTTIINAISYVLIAFVSISLVVSSIMIGIITYISVLERTKEIGILRAIGASKHDIARVFNAETLIEGLIAGLLGVGLTLVLILPINAVVQHLTDIASLGAKLPWQAGAALVAISMLLTFLAGLIPSSLAAKKGPVVALRTE